MQFVERGPRIHEELLLPPICENRLNITVEDDHPKVECAVVGVFSRDTSVARITLALLKEQQNRGQEAVGEIVNNGERMLGTWGTGGVTRVFGDRLTWQGSKFSTRIETYDRDHLPDLPGSFMAIGHNRYGTTGRTAIENAGPFLVDGFALAHNGNLTNVRDLKDFVLSKGLSPRGTTDSEILALYIVAQEGQSWDEKIIKGLKNVEGTYCLTMMTKDALYAAKDPMENRPLSLGRIIGEGRTVGWIVSSENSAIKSVGATIEREIKPGEIIKVDDSGVKTINQEVSKLARCPFEFLYLMRPDSSWLGKLVGDVRFEAGQWLYRDSPVEGAQAVTAIPYSAMLAAEGYAYEAKIPYLEIFYKDRLSLGRIFMGSEQKKRETETTKYSLLTDLLKRLNIKRLVMIDDSLVRGTTTGPLIRLLKDAIPELEVHLRITFPEILHPCFYAIDFGSYEEIFRHKFPELAQALRFLGVESLFHLKPARTAQIIGIPEGEICWACNNGVYSTKIPKYQNKHYLE